MNHEAAVIGAIVLAMIAGYMGPATLVASSQLLDCWTSLDDQHADDHVKTSETMCINPQKNTMQVLTTMLIGFTFIIVVVVLYAVQKSIYSMEENRLGNIESTKNNVSIFKKYGFLQFATINTGIGGLTAYVLYMDSFITMLNVHIPTIWIITASSYLILEGIHHREEFTDQRRRYRRILKMLPAGIAICHVAIVILYPMESHPQLQEITVPMQVCLALAEAALAAIGIAYMRRNCKESYKSQLGSIVLCAMMITTASISAITYVTDNGSHGQKELVLATALLSLLLTEPLMAGRRPRDSHKAAGGFDKISSWLCHRLEQVPTMAVIGIAMIAITSTLGAYILAAIFGLPWSP
ncbi:MAG: hypothetical protein MPJ06_08545 [Nitrosopumilus sp.]|nr:hypothetical protein [Nitrosopumilus sp.]MDA7944028.1 hypothetical protein [Nitrosopumilus sp.]MDA7999269.1 hypothetical protein [Nitrosopumilus sp.]